MRRIRKSMIWMGALLFCSGAVFAQKAERKNVREGNKLYGNEKFTESEIAYRKSLEVNPRSVEGTYNLGNALYKQKKFPEAAEQYQLLTGIAEKMAEIMTEMGNLNRQVISITHLPQIARLITMDLHADQIQGFFDVPVDHLYASGVILPYLQSLRLEDMVIASPDVGGSKRANTYAKYFGCPLVLCNKTRARANVVASMQIIGDVKDKNVVIIDDMPSVCSPYHR